MKFEPDITTWTDEQLEEAYKDAKENIKSILDTWPDDTLLTPTLRDVLDTVETEILERGLLIS